MRTLKNLYNEFNNEQKFIIKYIIPIVLITLFCMLRTVVINNLDFVL